jgi:hypothetical protein
MPSSAFRKASLKINTTQTKDDPWTLPAETVSARWTLPDIASRRDNREGQNYQITLLRTLSRTPGCAAVLANRTERPTALVEIVLVVYTLGGTRRQEYGSV